MAAIFYDAFEGASPHLQSLIYRARRLFFYEDRSGTWTTGTDAELAEAAEMYLVAADQAETERLDVAARELRSKAREMYVRLWARHNIPGVRTSTDQNAVAARSRRRLAYGHIDYWNNRDGTEARLFRITSPDNRIHFVRVNDRGEVRPA